MENPMPSRAYYKALDAVSKMEPLVTQDNEPPMSINTILINAILGGFVLYCLFSLVMM